MNLWLGKIGYYSPVILFLYSVLVLRKKMNYLNFYCVGFVLDRLLNMILKHMIQQPRPSDETELFNIMLNNERGVIDKYGMPSGHAESCFYSTFFVYFVTKDTKTFIIQLVISLTGLYQRHDCKAHSILQVFVGSIIGIGFAYVYYLYSEKTIKGLLKSKKDDDYKY